MPSHTLRTALAAGAPLALGAILASAAATAFASRRIDANHPPRGRFVEAGGVRWHVREEGAGPPALLIHGNAATAEDWRVSGLIDRLRGEATLIAPDRPGCGWSERPAGHWPPRRQAEAMAALLDALSTGPVAVIAHSIGVQVALWLAVIRPDLVRRLTLASGYAFPSLRLDALAIAPLGRDLIGAFARHTIATPSGALAAPLTLGAMFAPQEVPPGYGAGPFAPSLRPGQMRASAQDGGAMMREARALSRRIGEIAAPVVTIAGSRDMIVSPHQSHRIAAAAKDGRAVLIEGAGHMVHHAAPDAFADAVRSAASSLERA